MSAAEPVAAVPSELWARWQNTQRSVLRGIAGATVGHVFLRVRPGHAAGAWRLLRHLVAVVAGAAKDRPALPGPEFQLGLSFEGLQVLAGAHSTHRAALLDPLARKAPAFAMGADLRASGLGDVGRSAPAGWHASFVFRPHLVLSVYGHDRDAVELALTKLPREVVDDWEAHGSVPEGRSVPVWPAEWASVPVLAGAPPKRGQDGAVGFPIPLGLRDGVTQVVIDGVEPKTGRPLPPNGGKPHPFSESDPFGKPYPVGEFLLGYENLDGAQIWGGTTAVGDSSPWPVRDASFAVLRKMELDTRRWESYLEKASKAYGKSPEEVAAKLLGRGVDGRPLVPSGSAMSEDPLTWDAFTFHADREGRTCPFGSHIRRMNPRGDPTLVALRARPIIRRGLPYQEKDGAVGLLGLFFCASLEEQFEHLLAQWARRNPMGSGNQGAALDPFAPGDRDGQPFDIPGWAPIPGVTPPALPNVAVTRGSLYLFYPSLDGIAWLSEEPPASPTDT